MEEDCISTILNWPEPESVRDAQSFLRFANFHCWFVKEFSRIAHLLTDTTKKEAQRNKKDLALRKKDFLMTEACRFYKKFVATFTKSAFLVHFDAKRLIRLETDASGSEVPWILYQKHRQSRKS